MTWWSGVCNCVHAQHSYIHACDMCARSRCFNITKWTRIHYSFYALFPLRCKLSILMAALISHIANGSIHKPKWTFAFYYARTHHLLGQCSFNELIERSFACSVLGAERFASAFRFIAPWFIHSLCVANTFNSACIDRTGQRQSAHIACEQKPRIAQNE